MSEKFPSNRGDIRDFFKTANNKKRKIEESKNSLDFSPKNKKISREPLFELQPSYEVPSPEQISKTEMPKLQKANIETRIKEMIDEKEYEIPELEPNMSANDKPTKIGPKSKKRQTTNSQTKVRKKCVKKDSDLGPKEFSDESDEEKEKPENVKDAEAKSDDGNEEYEVEKILDYKWCLATVSLTDIPHTN